MILDDVWNNLSKTIQLAQRVKAEGLHFLLDIHYSDWWADPGSQTPPAAWTGLNAEQMTDSVYAYTFNLVTELQNAAALPDMVQIGNEIGCGMLWPFGAICGSNNTPQQWQNLADFLNAGSQAVHDAAGDSIQIMIHDFRGGDASGAMWFFSGLDEYNVSYDIIGLSYYPWWHGSLSELSVNMGNMAYVMEKPVVVVETAYPWTLAWNDNNNNVIGLEEQLLEGYPATPEGQLAFLADLSERIENVWGGYGAGLYYWEPAWISGGESGSPWENLALFDFQGGVLPAAQAFTPPTSVVHGRNSDIDARDLQIIPNPSNAHSQIQYRLGASGKAEVHVLSIEGKLLFQTDIRGKAHSEVRTGWNHTNLQGIKVPTGVYIVRIESGLDMISSKLLIIK